MANMIRVEAGTAPSSCRPRLEAVVTIQSFVIQTQQTLITLHPTELLESLGHPHGLRVDEGEEENVGAPLLVLVQPRLPVPVISVVTE